MNKGVDIDIVRTGYQRMSDTELVHVITTDAAGLTPEALEIVKAEISRRRLDTGIMNSVTAQNRNYTIEEIDEYCEIIRDLECPGCGNHLAKLNATVSSEAISIIFFTWFKTEIKIGCPDCLDKSNNIGLNKSMLLGWWGIPMGIIRTIQAININSKSKKTNHANKANDFLRKYTLFNIGTIEAYKNDTEKLAQVIAQDLVVKGFR